MKMSKPLFTKAGYRAKRMSTLSSNTLNWLFLPGGPGLGTESFGDLIMILKLPGNTWFIDYPNDGSNQHKNDSDFDDWKDGLIELLSSFQNIILVAHSFSGMFVLSDPRIEKHIRGLVLMNTAPDASWMQEMPRQAKKYNLPDVSALQSQYQKNPNDELFKKLTIACAPYFFSQKSIEKGKNLLEHLPYSHQSYDWAASQFHHNYQAKWIPQVIPTLIIGSEFDHITPIKLFHNNPQWKRNNIFIRSLSEVGHFPWIGHNIQLKLVFDDFMKYI